MEWHWWVVCGALFGWLLYRVCGEAVVRRAARRWFGSPAPGSIRLFGRGKLRPIQRLDSLEVPSLLVSDNRLSSTHFKKVRSRNRHEWAALGDGLVVGALAYRAAVASSDQAHQVLAELPAELDRIELDSDPSQFLTEAQRIGYESWLQGHIGEAVAANVLTQDGHQVEFAPLLNQPGWDLIVDGVPMNVKVGETAEANIAEHFERYPEIPVLTDPKTAASLDHPDVHGVPGLEPDRIEQLSAGVMGTDSTSLHDAQWDAHGGVDLSGSSDVGESLTGGVEGAAEAGAGILDVTVPLLTIGVSVLREDRLARQYGGDAAESIGAVAADAAGVWIGANAGAAFGFLFGPLGAILGAIGGALLGKSVVNDMRRSDVEAKIKELSPKISEIEDAVWLAVQRFEVEFNKIISRANATLRKSTQSQRAAFQNYIAELSREHDSATLIFLNSIYQLFDVFDRWLDLDLAEIRRRFPARHPIVKLLIPSAADASRELAEAWIAAKRAELRHWRDRFARFAAEKELTGNMDIKAARELMMDFFGKYKVWDAEAVPILRQSVLRFDDIAKKATAAHKQVMLSILEEYKKCEDSARKELNAVWDTHEKEIESMAQNLNEELRDLARQAARAGVNSIPSPLDFLARKSREIKQKIDRKTSRSRRFAQLPLLESTT